MIIKLLVANCKPQLMCCKSGQSVCLSACRVAAHDATEAPCLAATADVEGALFVVSFVLGVCLEGEKYINMLVLLCQ